VRLVPQVRGGQLATAEGVSYLEAKHLLLLSYCTNIVFYLLLKAEGRPVHDHPVIARLVQLRAYLVSWLGGAHAWSVQVCTTGTAPQGLPPCSQSKGP
jgi:Sas10/Utp3/C1D family